MKNKKRLGSIPKGLEWIEQEKQKTISTEKPKEYEVAQYHPPISRRPEKKAVREHVTASTKGLPVGWTRATLIVRESHLKKLKAVSYWDRVTIKHLVDQALDDFLADKNVRSLNVKKI